MVTMRIRHQLSEVLSVIHGRVDALYNLFLYLYLYGHHCLFYKPYFIQQILIAACHPNTRTEATCLKNPNTTQADESLSLNRPYHQSGEMRGFSWAGKRSRMSTLAEEAFWILWVHCLIQSARGGNAILELVGLKRWYLLSIVRLVMKFNLSSRHGQTYQQEHPPPTNTK